LAGDGKDRLKVAICASEMVPFAKTGGLADVIGSLPLALAKLGVEIKVVIPKYLSRQKRGRSITKPHPCAQGWDRSSCGISENVEVYFIENENYFNRENLYGDSSGDYPDNLERFAYFCRRSLTLLKETGFKPDIIHCHDWQTGLIPVYLKSVYSEDAFYRKTKSLFTIHNLAYQGVFPRAQSSFLGLAGETQGEQFWARDGNVNLLKAGLVSADIISTVSPTYANEIQTKEFGCGMEDVLVKRAGELYGIINGIDFHLWDPAKDEAIVKRYSLFSLEQKGVNKLALQEECGFKKAPDTPLIGIVSRLAEQKGFDLLAKSIDGILKLGAQIVVLGTGDEHYHRLFEKLAAVYPESISVNLRFDAQLARRIYAGSDFFLMPSRFEPCGLGQLISLRYGTVPVVRATGGLKDTIIDYCRDPERGNGFSFTRYKEDCLLAVLKEAIEVYRDKERWHNLVARAMECNFSWERSAREYLKLYKILKA